MSAKTRAADAWELADYARTVGNLRADLTKAQLIASCLLEAAKAHLVARKDLEDTPTSRLSPDDPRFKAITDTLETHERSGRPSPIPYQWRSAVILAVLCPSDPPISLAKRAACIGGSLFLDRVPITPERADALLYEWGSLAATLNNAGGEINTRRARIAARDALELERAMRAARMWGQASAPLQRSLGML